MELLMGHDRIRPLFGSRLLLLTTASLLVLLAHEPLQTGVAARRSPPNMCPVYIAITPLADDAVSVGGAAAAVMPFFADDMYRMSLPQRLRSYVTDLQIKDIVYTWMDVLRQYRDRIQAGFQSQKHQLDQQHQLQMQQQQQRQQHQGQKQQRLMKRRRRLRGNRFADDW